MDYTRMGSLYVYGSEVKGFLQQVICNKSLGFLCKVLLPCTISGLDGTGLLPLRFLPGPAMDPPG